MQKTQLFLVAMMIGAAILSTDAKKIISNRCFSARGSKDYVTMKCPQGMWIGSIMKATWGTFSATCEDPDNSEAVCQSSGKDTVSNACIGENSCVFQTSYQWFGNPCAGVRNRDLTLLVLYTCESGRDEYVAKKTKAPESSSSEESSADRLLASLFSMLVATLCIFVIQ